MSAKFTDLQIIARAVLDAPPKTVTESCIIQVLDSALESDAVIAQWPDSIPADWKSEPAYRFDIPAEIPRMAFVYGDRVDLYYDLWVAGVWSNYRSTRIMIQSIVLDCIFRVTLHESPQLIRQFAHAMEVSQQLVDDLCASVPFHIGTKMEGGPSNDAGVVYPYHATKGDVQRRASAALGGWHLVEPLKVAMKVKCLREGQREWLKQQLIRIGNVYSTNLLDERDSAKQ